MFLPPLLMAKGHPKLSLPSTEINNDAVLLVDDVEQQWK
jgi:hypothetical protein